MLKNIICICTLSCLIFCSCQKELSFEDNTNGNPGGGNTGGNSNGDLLVKTVAESSSGTVTTDFEYDPSKRLISMTVTGTRQGVDLGSVVNIRRNTSGNITQIVQKSALLAQSGLDSTATDVYYDAASSRYAYSISQLSMFGISIIDSMPFIYDASGKVIALEDWLTNAGSGPAVQVVSKFEYEYGANGNITSMSAFTLDPNTNSLQKIATYVRGFDDKPNPLHLMNEAFVLGNPDYYSTNNVITYQINDLTSGTSIVTLNTSYTYNSSNKPATGVSTQNPGNIVSNLTLNYK
jgi:hypothetical protein